MKIFHQTIVASCHLGPALNAGLNSIANVRKAGGGGDIFGICGICGK